MATEATTCQHTWTWKLDPCKEAGWHCPTCGVAAPGDPPGYRPDLDRELIEEKVTAVLSWLHEAEIISISNSDEGEVLIRGVSWLCREMGLFDQYSVARLILDAEAPGHAAYWGPIGEGVLAGADPRRRCWCGVLACSYQGKGDFCSEHAGDIFGEPTLGPATD